MTNNHDIGKGVDAAVWEANLEAIMKSVFIVYGGLTFERTAAGFVHNGILCRDHSDMDLLVSHEKEALANTLINTKVR